MEVCRVRRRTAAPEVPHHGDAGDPVRASDGCGGQRDPREGESPRFTGRGTIPPYQNVPASLLPARIHPRLCLPLEIRLLHQPAEGEAAGGFTGFGSSFSAAFRQPAVQGRFSVINTVAHAAGSTAQNSWLVF